MQVFMVTVRTSIPNSLSHTDTYYNILFGINNLVMTITKKVFLGLASIALALTSCSKDHDADKLGNQPNEVNDDKYVTLQLAVDGDNSLQSENQDLRTFFYLNANLPKFKFGNNGDKVKVQTIVSKRTGSGASLKAEILYDQIIDWTVANNGARLTYNGALKIERAKLAGDPTLVLVAYVTNKTNTANPRLFTPTPIQEITANQTALDLQIPYAMSFQLERAGAEGRQLKPKASVTTKFAPYGELAFFSIKNTGNANIVFTGLTGSNLTSATNTEFLTAGTTLLGGATVPAGTLLRNSFKVTTGNVTISPTANVTITPNQTKYFVAWRAQFNDVKGQPKDLYKPTFTQDLTINYPGAGTYSRKDGGLMKWAIEVSNKTESGNFFGDGVDFE